MARPAVVIALPPEEFAVLRTHLLAAGYEPLDVQTSGQLEKLLAGSTDIAAAILDGEGDFDRTLEMYATLREGRPKIPALIILAPQTLDGFGMAPMAGGNDEYLARPYTPESLRWRLEAMLIRAGSRTPEPLEPQAETAAPAGVTEALHRGQIVVIFNPKGGVGKTTIAVNLAAALQMRKHQRVLLVDCDIVTGHIAWSLGLQNVRTVAEAWAEDLETGAVEPFEDIARVHQSGVSVLVMAESPVRTEVLEPRRVADSISAACDAYDWVIVDMHPDYGPLNQVIFERADKILVPVTPDVPAIRAAVQFSQVATELGVRDRLAMVVNRANSGVSVADMERTVGMPALAEIRSAGMIFVRAANEGRSAVEQFPKEKVIEDIETLADRLMPEREGASTGSGLRSLFGGRGNLRAS